MTRFNPARDVRRLVRLSGVHRSARRDARSARWRRGARPRSPGDEFDLPAVPEDQRRDITMAISKHTKTPPTPKAGSSNPGAVTPAAGPSDETIAIRAYEIWRESGCAHGDDQAHWFRAQQELRTRAARGR